MRPNHQNNANKQRMRGRNRGGNGGGGGKGPNPLTRSYESNGPDVKIRGTAQHIAEKYLQLGRDAQATGDHVAAENYFQHAEHYLRIIAAANEQMRLANPNFRPYEIIDQDAEDDEDEMAAAAGEIAPRFQQPMMSDSEQPDIPSRAFQSQDDRYQQREFQPRPQREGREQRQDRDNRDFQPRDRDQREFQPREQRGEGRGFQPRDQRQPREQRDYQPREQRDYAPREQREFQPREAREPRDFDRRDQRDTFEPAPRGESEPQAREPRQPREGRFERRGPRPERQDRGMSAEPIDQAGLPAFITAPVRATVPTDMEQLAASAPVETAPAAAGAEAAPVRRGRGRPRKTVIEPAIVDDGK
jgi:hypothetical protein